MASLIDFGCFRKPFFDPNRIKFLQRQITKDFGIEMTTNVTEDEVDIENTFTNFRLGRRPKSPDDVFILGPMRDHPNVILNVGYGSHGFRAPPGGLILKSLIENDDEAYNALGQNVMDAVKSSRMFI